jgi:two-component system chemotaxis response regulator CheB
MAEDLKVLVVDDSAIYRSLVRGCLREIDGVECVGAAHDGRDAIEKTRQLQPDVVLLDVEMPVMSGVEALPELFELNKDLGVIMVSCLTTVGADVTMEALQLGALDFVTKPQVKAGEDGFAALRDPLARVIAAFRESRKHRDATRAPAPRAKGSKVPVVDAVAIGVSTGGPSALSELIPSLPGDLRVPVLVVQHMPARFTASLAESLDRKSKLRVAEAQDGQVLRAAEVLIAPGGEHMAIGGGDAEPHVLLRSDDPVNSFRPSVDVLFQSLCTAFEGRVLCVVMTGMGNDGLQGVRAIRERGGYCLAQDQASCAVYGMPRAVVEGGQADEVIDLEDLARRIVEIVSRR